MLKLRDGTDFIIRANRTMDAFEHLVDGALWCGRDWNSMPWEIGHGKGGDHYLFAVPSEKRIMLAETGRTDADNWEAYYTNIDPREFEGGGTELHRIYRLR